MHMIIKRLIKWLVRAISVFLPEEKAHDLQRWRRGKEEFWKYKNCQYIFASYGKSGRTWVRVMISRARLLRLADTGSTDARPLAVTSGATLPELDVPFYPLSLCFS